MGFSSGNVHHLTWLGRDGHIPNGARVLDFGSQNFYGGITEDAGKALFSTFGRPEAYRLELFADKTKIEDLMAALGFDYVAFDMFDAGRTQKFDFNYDSLPRSLRGQFDLVLNLGTSEHVANQFNLFKTAHDALKVGGVLYNFNPFFGAQDHGLFNYHPKFFTTLIYNNAYQPLYWDFSHIFTANEDGYHNVSGAVNGAEWEGTQPGAALMNVIAKKTTDDKFMPPTDAVTLNDEFVAAPTVNAILGFTPPISVARKVVRRWPLARMALAIIRGQTY